MKLLLYSHFFAPSVGGVETAFMLLATGLAGLRRADARSEFEVTVVTETARGEFRDDAASFRIVRKPALRTLWRLIREADVVHVAGPSLLPLALTWLMHKPVVLEHHGFQAICPNGLLLLKPDNRVCPGHFQQRRYRECIRCERQTMAMWRALWSLARMFPRSLLWRRATWNIAISKALLNRLETRRGQVIYYGLPGEPAKCSPMLRDQEPVTFAFVGRFVEEKGIHLLIQAASVLHRLGKRFRLLLIGDGPQRKSLEKQIATLHLTNLVQITGYLGGADLAAATDAADVVVMPSIWEETAGLAAIEQMWRGKGVVAAKIGGLAEIVEDAGLTFEPGSAEALAARMGQIVDQPRSIAALGEKARARAQQTFAAPRMIEEHAAVYLKLADKVT